MVITIVSRLIILVLCLQLNIIECNVRIKFYISEILREYSLNYTVIIHYDNKSSPNHVILPNSISPVVLFNYDMPMTDGRKPRYCCGQFSDSVINVVLLNDTRMFENEFSSVAGNLKPLDAVLQITANAESMKSKRPLLTNPRIIRQYIYLSHEREMRNITQTDLRVITFGYIGCAEIIDLHIENGYTYYTGVEYKLVQLMAEMLKAELIVKNYGNITRTEMMEKVRDEEVSFAGGCLSSTDERRKIVNFTPNFYANGYKLYFSALVISKHLAFLGFAPFNNGVLYLILLTPLTLGVLITLWHKISKIPSNVNVTIFVPALVEQPVTGRRIPYIVRTFLMAWLFGAMVFTSAYKSKLSSLLIAPHLDEPDHILQAIERSYNFYIPHLDLSFPNERVNASLNKQIRALAKRWTRIRFCDSYKVLNSGLNGMIMEGIHGKPELYNTCNYSKEQLFTFRESAEYVFVSGQCWAIKHYSRVNEFIILGLEMMKAHGLVQYWYSTYNITRPILTSNTVSSMEPQPLKLNVFYSHFIIIAIGETSAIILFLTELVIAKITHPAHGKYYYN